MNPGAKRVCFPSYFHSPLGGLLQDSTIYVRASLFTFTEHPLVCGECHKCGLVATKEPAHWANIIGTKAASPQGYKIYSTPIPVVTYMTFTIKEHSLLLIRLSLALLPNQVKCDHLPFVYQVRGNEVQGGKISSHATVETLRKKDKVVSLGRYKKRWLEDKVKALNCN